MQVALLRRCRRVTMNQECLQARRAALPMASSRCGECGLQMRKLFGRERNSRVLGGRLWDQASHDCGLQNVKSKKRRGADADRDMVASARV